MTARPLAPLLVLACLLGPFTGCGPKKLEKEFPPTQLKRGAQEGVSSWYGKDFHGNPTASGEIYDMYGLSAAHRTLPLGTVVEVTNLDNGRSAVLKINDRGPFIKGRILDCSYGAARELDFANAGLARVRVEVLEEGTGRTKPSRGPSGGGRAPTCEDEGSLCVQVGAFASRENADNFRDLMEQKAGDAFVVRYREFYRVRVGRMDTEEEAADLQERLAEMGYEGFVTRND